MIKFHMTNSLYNSEVLGLIPLFLNEHDERPAAEQFNEHYAHGGGWRPFEGFTMEEDQSIIYPGDLALRPIARATLREEKIIVYPLAWVAVVQLDGSFEISRMD